MKEDVEIEFKTVVRLGGEEVISVVTTSDKDGSFNLELHLQKVIEALNQHRESEQPPTRIIPISIQDPE
jgi:hypothetical protein